MATTSRMIAATVNNCLGGGPAGVLGPASRGGGATVSSRGRTPPPDRADFGAEDDLRVDVDAVLRMRLPLVREVARRYRRQSVTAFLHWLERHTRDGQ